jgi:hypothetical protein
LENKGYIIINQSLDIFMINKMSKFYQDWKVNRKNKKYIFMYYDMYSSYNI